jgi:hypothetical protein
VRSHDEHCLLSLESAQKGIEYFAYLAVGLGITSRIGGKSMSSRNDVLSVLWSGKSKIVAGDETIVFSALLLELFPGKTILVGVEDGAIPERVLLDDTEVMPSLSLGDVVAEELNITVPYGTVIVFRALFGLLANGQRRTAWERDWPCLRTNHYRSAPSRWISDGTRDGATDGAGSVVGIGGGTACGGRPINLPGGVRAGSGRDAVFRLVRRRPDG